MKEQAERFVPFLILFPGASLSASGIFIERVERKEHMAKKITKKMKDFADAYIKNGSIYKSAIEAGYSDAYARSTANKLLENVIVKNYIDEQMEKIQSEKVASAEEIIQYLTSVMRGESTSEEIVVEGTGNGFSETRHIQKKPSEKDRLKACELLGKRYALFTEKTQIEGVIPIVISGGDDLED